MAACDLPHPMCPTSGHVGVFPLTEARRQDHHRDRPARQGLDRLLRLHPLHRPLSAGHQHHGQLQSELGKEPDLRLVTFTVDPGRDDPKELTKYADHFQADPKRWLFLTGKEAAIDDLLIKGFKVPVDRSGKELGHEPPAWCWSIARDTFAAISRASARRGATIPSASSRRT